MLKKVSLRHYRGFETLDVHLGAVTGLIGPNSSGKTSVLHAIRLACDSLSEMVNERDTRPEMNAAGVVTVCWRDVVPDPGALVSLSDWFQVFKDASVGDGVSLSIGLEFEASDSVQSLSLDLSFGRNTQLLRTVRVKSSAATAAISGMTKRARGRRERLRDELKRAAPMAVLVPPFYGVTRTEEYRTQAVVNRLLGAGDHSHIVRNLVARLNEPAIERLNRFLEPVRARVVPGGAQVDAETRADLLVQYSDDNGKLEISSAGAGLINLIALFAAMYRLRGERTRSDNRPVLFLLDEPEAHLHPRLQGDVGNALADLAVRDFGLQLILATHSVEMINRLGRRDDAMLLYVDRRTGTAVELQSESEVVEALDRFCDLTPFTSLNFLASRRVLFHEGPTDAHILDSCARLAYQDDPNRLPRWKEFTLVSLAGVGNVSAQGVLKAVLSPKVFRNVQGNKAVRAGLVRDRDWKLDPKPPTRSAVTPHFEAIEVVWSRHSVESLFLDADCLTAWIAPTVGLDAATVRALVVTAIADADKDQALEDEAYAGRYPFHRRPDKNDKKMLQETEAAARTRNEVRTHPEIFQQGHSRAGFVLHRVRQSLPAAARHRLRGQLSEVIASAPIDKVSPGPAVPTELRAFLDLLVAP